MAISTPITTDSGLAAPDAYLRVADLQHSKTGPGQYVIHFCVAFYASQDAANAGMDAICPPRQFLNVNYDLNGANPYIQAYDYLKAGPYVGATDII